MNAFELRSNPRNNALRQRLCRRRKTVPRASAHKRIRNRQGRIEQIGRDEVSRAQQQHPQRMRIRLNALIGIEGDPESRRRKFSTTRNVMYASSPSQVLARNTYVNTSRKEPIRSVDSARSSRGRFRPSPETSKRGAPASEGR